MARKPYAFIRAHRRKWGLTQVELARLIGFASRSAVSRMERAKRPPATETIIACGIIFGLDIPELFPSLHEEIEQEVLASAVALNKKLARLSDSAALRKRKLLEEILERIRNRKHNTKV